MANIVLDSLPFYPPTYNPETQRVQWMDQIPKPAVIDPNFRWIMPRGENTLQELVDMGVTNFTRADMNQPGWDETQISAFRNKGYGYDDVPQTPTMFSLADRGQGASQWVSAPGTPVVWPIIWNQRFWNTPPGATEPMSVEQGALRGQAYSAEHTVVIFENSEQDHAISSHWPFVKAWSEAWNAKVIARWPGKKTLRAWNYFTGFGETIRYSTAAERKAFINSPVSSWVANPMLPGGNLETYNAVCFGVYLQAPDDVKHIGYDIIFQTLVARKANKELIVFEQPVHEWLPNNKRVWNLPEGKFYYQGKLNIAPGIGYAIALFGRVFAAAFASFGFGGKSTKPFKLDPQWHDQGFWVKAGDPEMQLTDISQSPVFGPRGSTQEVFASGGQEDMSGFARWLWDRSFANVMGGTDSFLEFRVDGGAWRTMTGNFADDLINAFYGDGYFVFCRQLNNKYAYIVYNGKAEDSIRHKVEWKSNGQVLEGYISGTIPFVFYKAF